MIGERSSYKKKIIALLKIQFVRFLLTGLLNTLFSFVLFSLFMILIGHTYWSLFWSTIVGVIFNFKTYSNLVFDSKDYRKLFRFCLAYTILITVQMGMVRILSSFGLSNPFVSVAILAIPMAFFSFILLKKFVFNQPILFESK